MWGQYYTLTVYLGYVELLELTTCKLEGYKEQLGWDWTLTVSLFFFFANENTSHTYREQPRFGPIQYEWFRIVLVKGFCISMSHLLEDVAKPVTGTRNGCPGIL